MKQIFTEIGLGNPTFINTEIEHPNGHEERRPGFMPMKRLKSLYLRLWLGKTVYSADIRRGFKRTRKPRKAFKLLFGIHGESA